MEARGAGRENRWPVLHSAGFLPPQRTHNPWSERVLTVYPLSLLPCLYNYYVFNEFYLNSYINVLSRQIKSLSPCLLQNIPHKTVCFNEKHQLNKNLLELEFFFKRVLIEIFMSRADDCSKHT